MMAIDGFFIHHMVQELALLVKGRIQKIHHISETELLFTVRAQRENYSLLLSAHPDYARIHLTQKTYDTPSEPSMFMLFLRKHLEGGVITDIKQHQNDRVVIFTIVSSNDIGDLEEKQLIHEVMGRHANIIITKEGKVLESLKHVLPFENQHRILFPNAEYLFPLSQEKLNPFALPKSDIITTLDAFAYSERPKALMTHFEGVSPLLSKLFEQAVSTETLVDALFDKPSPTKIITPQKTFFYWCDLPHIEGNHAAFSSLSSLLDDIFYDLDLKVRIKQKSHDLNLFIKKQLEKSSHKREKLQSELEQAKNLDQYRVKGELIIANLHAFDAKQSEIEVFNYYTNTYQMIALDPRLTLKQNAQKYYQKYQKAKNALIHIQEQIDKTEEDIAYFSLLEAQLEVASLSDVLEMKEELEELGYLRKQGFSKTSRKKAKLNYLSIKVDENALLYIGKNNKQNAVLTHELAQGNDYWLHVKDAPGSHVILKCDELTEPRLRLAAKYAAYYSKLRYSSSIPVDYTRVKYVKKIPGKLLCFVSYSQEKTIFIDLDDAFLHEVK